MKRPKWKRSTAHMMANQIWWMRTPSAAAAEGIDGSRAGWRSHRSGRCVRLPVGGTDRGEPAKDDAAWGRIRRSAIRSTPMTGMVKCTTSGSARNSSMNALDQSRFVVAMQPCVVRSDAAEILSRPSNPVILLSAGASPAPDPRRPTWCIEVVSRGIRRTIPGRPPVSRPQHSGCPRLIRTLRGPIIQSQRWLSARQARNRQR